jgi:hypothetical protein
MVKIKCSLLQALKVSQQKRETEKRLQGNLEVLVPFLPLVAPEAVMFMWPCRGKMSIASGCSLSSCATCR